MIGRAGAPEWLQVRRLHVKLALGLPLVVDVELNEVLAAPDAHWRDFVANCAGAGDQALFVARVGARCVGMGHVRRLGAEARLAMLYVEPVHRRAGLASALVGAQARWAAAGGPVHLAAYIPGVSAAGSLASALGWHRTPEVFTTRHGLEERRWTAPAPDAR